MPFVHQQFATHCKQKLKRTLQNMTTMAILNYTVTTLSRAQNVVAQQIQTRVVGCLSVLEICLDML